MLWYIVLGCVILYQHLIFIWIRYGSSLYVVCRCAPCRGTSYTEHNGTHVRWVCVCCFYKQAI